jgi:nucleoside-diphosphate-sugar epimerase
MNTALKHILVVGGNGFIGLFILTIYFIVLIFCSGSAVCKAALAQGIQVTSVR